MATLRLLASALAAVHVACVGDVHPGVGGDGEARVGAPSGGATPCGGAFDGGAACGAAPDRRADAPGWAARDPELDRDRFDRDGGGSSSGEHCDGGDPTNRPGNPELCDGRDNDCDGLPERELALVGEDPWPAPAGEASACAVAAGAPVPAVAACLDIGAGPELRVLLAGAARAGPALAAGDGGPSGCRAMAAAGAGSGVALIWLAGGGLRGAWLDESGRLLAERRLADSVAASSVGAAWDGGRLGVVWVEEGSARLLVTDPSLAVASVTEIPGVGRAQSVAVAGLEGRLLVACATTDQETATDEVRVHRLAPDGAWEPSFRLADAAPGQLGQVGIAPSPFGFVAAWTAGGRRRIEAAGLGPRGTIYSDAEVVATAPHGRSVVTLVVSPASGRGGTDGVGLAWTEMGGGATLGELVLARLDAEARPFGDRLVVGTSLPGALSGQLAAGRAEQGLALCWISASPRGGRLSTQLVETCF